MTVAVAKGSVKEHGINPEALVEVEEVDIPDWESEPEPESG